MNKLFNKIAIASLSFAMSVGIGVALFHSDKTQHGGFNNQLQEQSPINQDL